MQLSFRKSQHILAALVVVAAASCSSDEPPAATGSCGNGKIEGNEQCDGTTLKTGENCRTASMGTKTGGRLLCSKCMLDTSQCTPASGSGGQGGLAGMAGTGAMATMGAGGAQDSGGADGSVDASSDVSADSSTTPDSSTDVSVE